MNKKGQVLVETALLLPLLLVVVFGLVDFGRAMYTKNTLNNAARAGARAAIITPELSTVPNDVPLFTQSASLDPTKTIQRNIVNGIPTDNTIMYKLLRNYSSVSGTFVAGNQAQIILTYPNFPMITPLFKLLALISGSSVNSVNSQTITLTGQASMRYEQ